MCRSTICPPVYSFHQIFSEWYTSRRLENWLHNTYLQKGNKTKVNNYRPVCLTSVVIKILESIIRDNLSNYLSDNNLLSPNQHGFIPRRSCCTQLLHALNNWTLSLDEHLSTDVIYFDFSKTFDSVPHTRLLLKLQAYEINGQLLNWFKNFQICT